MEPPWQRLVREHPWRVVAAAALLLAPLYGLASRPSFFRPWVIAAGALDARVPLVPAAVIPYLTYFLLLPALVLAARRNLEFPRVLAAALACWMANVALYFVCPTRLAARPAVPAGTLLAILQRFDTPLCALPSGHVALPMAIAVAALLAARGGPARAWRRTAALFFAWTLLLAGAAWLTGQHYLVDLLAGLALGAVVAVVTFVATAERVALHRPSVIALAAEWGVIVLAAGVVVAWWSPWIALPAALVIATRQHALFVLYHDAVHGHIARPRRLNDFLINAAVGVPLLLPVHLYRALHLSHHRHLGSRHDPERVLLYRGQRWSYRPLATGPLAVQLAGDLLGWNALAMSWRYLAERRRGGMLRLPRTHAYPELIFQFALFAALWGGGAILWPATALRLALLWFVPYLTLTQLLQKIRSFAEHADGDADAGAPDERSCSWAPGLAGRLTIWPYNINYHREHHARPGVPWNRLPAAFPAARQRPGADLRWHLWRGERR